MEIQHLRRQGLRPGQIARRTGIDRKTVAKYLKRPVTNVIGPVVQVSRQRSSKVDPFTGYLKERLEAFPELFAETLYYEIQARGYTGSARTLRRYLARARTQRPRRIYRPVETPPGRQAQVDWGHFGTIVHHGVVRHLYAFVLVLSWSRQRYVEFTVSQDMATFLACHARALAALGGVPAEIVYDNAKTVVKDRVGSVVQFTPDLLRFALAYGFKPRACWAYDLESKGKVESAEERVTPARAGAARGLQARFEAIGPAARDYLKGLAAFQHEHLSDQAKGILELAGTYGSQAVLQAMERAMQFRAYGLSILRRILEKAEREPGASPALPTPRAPFFLAGVPALQVERRDLAGYALAGGREG